MVRGNADARSTKDGSAAQRVDEVVDEQAMHRPQQPARRRICDRCSSILPVVENDAWSECQRPRLAGSAFVRVPAIRVAVCQWPRTRTPQDCYARRPNWREVLDDLLGAPSRPRARDVKVARAGRGWSRVDFLAAKATRARVSGGEGCEHRSQQTRRNSVGLRVRRLGFQGVMQEKNTRAFLDRRQRPHDLRERACSPRAERPT